MKRSFRRFRLSKLSSFTLVELLVVMAIIAILAAVIFSAGTTAMRAALRTKALNLANTIQTGVLSYYTEYSVYPVPTGTTTDYEITDATNQSSAWGNVICGLAGNINPSTGSTPSSTNTISNTRSIAFISLKASDVDGNGAPENPLPVSTANPYFNIGMDSDYDGVVPSATAGWSMPNFASTTFSTSGGKSTVGVAVWANCNSTTSSTNSAFYVHTY